MFTVVRLLCCSWLYGVTARSLRTHRSASQTSCCAGGSTSLCASGCEPSRTPTPRWLAWRLARWTRCCAAHRLTLRQIGAVCTTPCGTLAPRSNGASAAAAAARENTLCWKAHGRFHTHMDVRAVRKVLKSEAPATINTTLMNKQLNLERGKKSVHRQCAKLEMDVALALLTVSLSLPRTAGEMK